MVERYQYQAIVKKIVDGDTIDVDIDLASLSHLRELIKPPVQGDYVDLGFSVFLPMEWATNLLAFPKSIWLRDERIRFYGINTPELHASDPRPGQAAKNYLQPIIPVKSIVTLQTFRVKQRTKQEKYGRFLAIVKANGVNLNEQLVKLGYAKPFMID